MNAATRRQFIKGAAAASAAALCARPSRATGEPGGGREIIEIRCYRLRDGAPAAPLHAYLSQALVPALNARGSEAVGVFTEPEAKGPACVWVVIPYPSLEAFVAADASLNADPLVRERAAAYLASPKDHPAFDRVDSWLHLSFEGQPRLSVPALARQGAGRIFEMRTYESHSEERALKKVAMFNAGEIAVMRELNLSPVFYGQALVGRDLPHLTYMLCSPDRETHKRNWTAFTVHPVWVRLKADPQYADAVSKVTSRFLVPEAYSQI